MSLGNLMVEYDTILNAYMHYVGILNSIALTHLKYWPFTEGYLQIMVIECASRR